MLNKLQELINNGTVTVGQENGLYESKTPILFEREYLSIVEDFRVDADPESLGKVEYLIIVDFSILSFTETKHLIDLSNVTLNNGIKNYSPIRVTKTEEATTHGCLLSRFDLVFSVPVSSRAFEFTFNTGLDTVGKIRFTVDINTLESKIGTPESCTFIDDPVELIIPQQSDTITHK